MEWGRGTQLNLVCVGPVSYSRTAEGSHVSIAAWSQIFSPATHPYLHNLFICHEKLISKVSKNISLQHLCDYESARGEEERQAKKKGGDSDWVQTSCFVLYTMTAFFFEISDCNICIIGGSVTLIPHAQLLKIWNIMHLNIKRNFKWVCVYLIIDILA